MNTLRNILTCILLVALIVVCLGAYRLLETTRETVASVPVEIAETRVQLLADLSALSFQIEADLNQQLTGLRRDAAGQTAALRTETLQRVDSLTALVDSRTGQVLQIADARLKETTEAVSGIRADVRPVLDNSAALVADARDSWDDLYPDIKGSVASATVAVTGVARASEAVGNAAPSLVRSADGIAADVHQITADIARPKTFWGKVRAVLETIGKVGARLI